MPPQVIVIGGVAAGPKTAAKILQGAGFSRVRVMDGGVAVWPFEKLHGQV